MTPPRAKKRAAPDPLPRTKSKKMRERGDDDEGEEQEGERKDKQEGDDKQEEGKDKQEGDDEQEEGKDKDKQRKTKEDDKRKEEKGEQGKDKQGARNAKGEMFWEISDKRRVTISKFAGRLSVDVREYYEKDGELLPGKKGISLSVGQLSALISFLPHIEKVLVDHGEKGVGRPDYSLREDEGASKRLRAEGSEEDEEGALQAKRRKKNFELTSDEE